MIIFFHEPAKYAIPDAQKVFLHRFDLEADTMLASHG
jgi:hypothetical protein